MSDDDQSPTIITGGQAGGAGFSAFGDDERKAERRARRKNLAVKSLAGALVLVAVGVVAAVTSNGNAKTSKPPVAVATAKAGDVKTPIPPEVLFRSALDGYALYLNCDAQPVGQYCRPALYRTTNGAVAWEKVALPTGAPVDQATFLSMQVNADYLLLAWTTGFIAVLPKDSATWSLVVGKPAGSVSTLAAGSFLIGNGTPMWVVDPAKATAVKFRPPQNVELPGVTGGVLTNGNVWMRDTASIGVSAGAGVSWNVVPLVNADAEATPLAGGQLFLAFLTGPAKDATVGPTGDGGVLPARTAFFSTDGGTTWGSPTTFADPTVNALCTVYLDGDHSLLGVAADGKSLLSLPADVSKADARSFVAAKPVPPAVPSCLQSHDSLVWGVSQAAPQRVVLSVDGAKTWKALPMPLPPHAIATPSPTPSAAK